MCLNCLVCPEGTVDFSPYFQVWVLVNQKIKSCKDD